MSATITADDLRGWLEERRPVTVLDVREDDDRTQWSIPGSIHVNVYRDLREGRPGELARLELPPDRPVVTVCNLGRMSAVAAEHLKARGVHAISLEGGMKAWSLAWNTAQISLSSGTTQALQVRRTGKGCLSYIVASGGEAAVIDPSVAPEVYRKLAADHDWKIRWVLDTHIHADHLSRARSLADACGADLLLPAQDRVRFPFHAISDGSSLGIGGATLRALSTPGHTAESLSYVLDDQLLFTGDTLFLAGVGRPDLHTGDEEARARAALLYRSIRHLLSLDPRLLVFPTHHSEPLAFDRAPHGAPLGEVAGRIQHLLASESGFVDWILGRLPPTPPNYDRIVEWNERGVLPDGDPTDLEAGANRCAVS
jgi:glyoxylase-like metal-dependent hydrolase (beta-lactamase superfamily II)/rhodanese-related sulfurtransferase